ncbi:MAG: hypothetical protein IPN42_10395 [Methylococcaceae bacterium]|nr:hypothetical protein [Methylococcaceae bacterium]
MDISKLPVSRADLLRGLILAGANNLESIAELTGYQAPMKSPLRTEPPDSKAEEKKTDPGKIIDPDPDLPPHSGLHYYRIVDRKPSELLPELPPGETQFPDWFDDIPALDVDNVKAEPITPPEKEPLVQWANFWPMLQALLSETKRSRQIDIKRLVNQMARAEIPARIPRRLRSGWIAGLQILVERADRTELFNHDYNQLLLQLQKLRGETGLQVQQLVQRPGGIVRIKQGDRYLTQSWRLPESGSEIMILSDLGLLDQTGQVMQDWLRFGRRLRMAGFTPVVLIPLPQRYLIPELLALFTCVCWTRHSGLRPVRSVPVAKQTFDHPKTIFAQDSRIAFDLLAWLSPAVRIEPALLRAVAYHLPAPHNDSGVETAAWLHEDVQATSIGFYFKPQQLEKYRKQFRSLATDEPLRAKTIVQLLRRYHRHVFPTQLHEEMLILAALMGDQLDSVYQPEIEAASLHGKQLLKALVEKPAGTEGLTAFTAHASERQPAAVLKHQQCEFWPAMLGVLMREQNLQPNSQLVQHITASPEALRTFLAFANEGRPEKLDYVLFQFGSKTLQASTLSRYQAGDSKGFSEGSLLLELSVAARFGLQQKQTKDGNWDTLFLPLNNDDVQTFQFEEKEAQKLHIAGEELTIERFTKPEWTVGIGRYHDVLTVTTRSANKLQTWYWHPTKIDRVF